MKKQTKPIEWRITEKDKKNKCVKCGHFKGHDLDCSVKWKEDFNNFWNQFTSYYFDLGTNNPDDISLVRNAKEFLYDWTDKYKKEWERKERKQLLEELWVFLMGNNITDKKSFVVLRNHLNSLFEKLESAKV